MAAGCRRLGGPRVYRTIRHGGPAVLLLAALAGCARDGERAGRPVRLLEDPSPPLRELADLDGEALEEILGRPFKVDLGHEVSNALAAVPGRPIALEARVRAGQELELGWGMPAGARRPVTFRVLAEVGERSEELWRSRLEPAGAGRWHRDAVDLGGLAGERVRLMLTAGSGGAGEGPGLAFWAAPEIVAAHPEPPPNVLLVSVDTLRADRLSSYGHDRQTSPRLDAWAARNATLFRRAVAAAPWTLPSHVSMLTGLDALRHGVNHDVGGVRDDAGRFPNASLETLAEVLWRRGYATAAWTGGAYLHPKYGFAQGFDRYLYWPDRATARRELEAGVDRALEWMAAVRDRPFFAFLHTYAVHDPYVARQPHFDRLAPDGEVALRSPPNEPARGFQQQNHFVLRSPGTGERRLGDADRPLVEALYDSGVAYADQELGRLLDGLDALGLGGRTVVVVTSDHGEALGEDGRAGHVDLHDATLLVPLLIALPGGRGAGRTVERQVRSIDLVPTVLEAVGMDLPENLDGVSLLPLVDGSPGRHRPADVPAEAWSYSAAANYGLSLSYGGRLKYVFNNTVWPPVAGREELYDLLTDPGERRDLAGDDPRIAVLRQRLREVWERQSTGLELRIANATRGVLRGEVEGAMVRPVGTKSLDAGAGFLAWREMGKAAFEVPAEESLTVVFEKAFGRRMELSGELAVGRERYPFRGALEVAGETAAAVLRFDGTSWEHAERGPAATGFEARWRGPERLYADPPSASDPELRRQLEALGYLD